MVTNPVDMIQDEHDDDSGTKRILLYGTTTSSDVIPLILNDSGSIMAEYLKLDCSNDPLTGTLNLNEHLTLLDSKQIRMGDSGAADYYQEFNGTDTLFFTSGVFQFMNDAIIQAQAGGTGGQDAGYDLTIRGGDALELSDENGGNLYMYAGDADGAGTNGILYLGHNGSSQKSEVWMYLTTPLYLGDPSNNSASIYHDGDNLIIDSRSTGTGGTLLFPTGMEIEGDINFNQVDEITLAQAQAIVLTENASAGTLAAGEYHYDVCFITNEGTTSTIQSTHGTAQVPDITISANSAITLTNIPISPDRRVTGRCIMRTEANEVGYIAQQITIINDNTTTTYQDTGDAAGTGALNYKKPNNTAGTIKVENDPYLIFNEINLFVGKNAGIDCISYDNTAFGNFAFDAATTCVDCSVFGTDAGTAITSGGTNSFFGRSAGNFITKGVGNCMFGAYSYGNSGGTNADNNSFFGKEAGNNSVGAGQDGNCYFGYQAGRNFGGGFNTCLGYRAGNISSRIASSWYNIIIGNSSGTTLETAANYNIIIGNDVEPDDTAGSYQLNIGNVLKGDVESGKEHLKINGGLITPIVAKTGNYTLTTVDYTVLLDGTSGTVTATLPTAATYTGKIYVIKCINDDNQTDIATNGSEEIDGDATNFVLNNHEVIRIQSDGTNWWII